MTSRILVGDVLDGLAQIESGSVQCCVTSPPYWGLRDYGTAKWEGGSAGCDHSPEKRGGRFASPVSGKQASNTGSGTASTRECPCGARRIDAQIGLEPTPAEYVARLVAVFDEVRRVLRDDGTVWLNLGDSYCGGGKGGNPPGSTASAFGNGARTQQECAKSPKMEIAPGLKPKDLVGIPWRVAFALQAAGWYLRSDIIWAKPNPMPESVTDRPTKAHEYVFLLSKSARYFYDAGAIAEPSTTSRPELLEFGERPDLGGLGHMADRRRAKARPPSGKHSTTAPQSSGRRITEGVAAARAAGADHDSPFGPTRNARSVWTIATSPYPEAHFATFPEELPERCIKAGSKRGDLILDPFSGSGTVGAVAERLGRDFIGCELNPAYAALAEKRIAASQSPMFDAPPTIEPLPESQRAMFGT